MYIVLDLRNFPDEIDVARDIDGTYLMFHEEAEAEEYAESMLGHYQIVALEE